jgi:histidine triad (HIT) family protein
VTAGCIFCQIVAGEIQPPSGILKRWPDAVAFEPLNPVTPGHLLIVPVAHVSSYRDDPVVSATTMARAAELAQVALNWAESNLITSCGDAATQTIHHLHLHLVPRHAGDGLHLPWSHPITAERR